MCADSERASDIKEKGEETVRLVSLGAACSLLLENVVVVVVNYRS